MLHQPSVLDKFGPDFLVGKFAGKWAL
jgi:hypothetical protein